MKLFNFNLYLSTLKYSYVKIISIIMCIMVTLFNVANPLFIILQKTPYNEVLGSRIFNPFYVMCTMIVFPFLLTMVHFGFLNNRSKSDFYHSVPIKRSTMFLTFSAVLITCELFVILISSGITLFTYSFVPGAILLWEVIPFHILALIVGCLFVNTACLIASSITGQSFATFSMSMVFVFIPNLIFFVFAFGVDFLTGTTLLNTSVLFNLNNNLVYRIIMYMDLNIVNLTPVYFTLVFALIYYVFAYVLYVKRKSEIANQSSPTKLMQHVYRLLVTLPFVLPLPIVLIQKDEVQLFQIATFFIISLVCYLGYELITTKRTGNLIKSLPVYLVLVAFVAVFTFGIESYATSLTTNLPNATEIESVTFELPYMDRNPSFESIERSKVEIKDQSVNTIVIDNLKAQSSDENIPAFDVASFYYVDINLSDGTTIRRHLEFDTADTEFIHSKYPEDFSIFPNEDTILSYSGEDGLSEETLKSIYEVYKEEYNEDSISTDNAYLQITLQGYYDGTIYSSTYPINSATPKALEMYANALNEQNLGEYNEIVDKLPSPRGVLQISDLSFDTVDSTIAYNDSSIVIAKDIIAKALTSENNEGNYYLIEAHLESNSAILFLFLSDEEYKLLKDNSSNIG